MHRQKLSMADGPLLRNMMMFTFPIILTSILQLLFNAADLVIVGQFGQSGSNAIAAVGCTAAISNLMINFFIGFSAGSGVIVAHAIGAKNSLGVRNAVHTIIPLSAFGGAIISVLGIVLAEPMLKLMDTPDDIIGLSVVYMRIIFAGMLPNMIYNFGASILRAAGDSKKPLYFLAISGVVNVVLNLLFVIVLRMDVAGVALATIISQILSAILVLISLIKRTDDCKLELNKLKFHKASLKRIISMGFPAGIQSSLFSISNIIIQSSINGLEVLYVGVVAGNAACANINGFLFAISEGFKQTAMNFIGHSVGAGRFDRVKKISTISLWSITIVGILVGILMTVFSKPLLSIYISDSPEAIHWGIVRMFYMCLPFFIAGIMDVTTGILRGMGQSVFPMAASILGVCVFRVVWIYTIFAIPKYHTPDCLWFSYVISWALTFVIQYIVIVISINRKLKQQRINDISESEGSEN